MNTTMNQFSLTHYRASKEYVEYIRRMKAFVIAHPEDLPNPNEWKRGHPLRLYRKLIEAYPQYKDSIPFKSFRNCYQSCKHNPSNYYAHLK